MMCGVEDHLISEQMRRFNRSCSRSSVFRELYYRCLVELQYTVCSLFLAFSKLAVTVCWASVYYSTFGYRAGRSRALVNSTTTVVLYE